MQLPPSVSCQRLKEETRGQRVSLIKKAAFGC